MTAGYEVQLVASVKRVEERQETFSRHAKGPVEAMGDERVDDQICDAEDLSVHAASFTS